MQGETSVNLWGYDINDNGGRLRKIYEEWHACGKYENISDPNAASPA